MAGGVDHNIDRKKRQARAVTLREAYDEYTSLSRLTANTLRDYRKAMDKGFADWKDKPIPSINRDMIERRFNELSKASPAQANQMFRFLRALFNYAMEKYGTPDGEPLIPSNPCNRLTALDKWNRIERRTRYIEPEKLKAWFAALEHTPQDSTHRSTVRDLCALLLLTGLREQQDLAKRQPYYVHAVRYAIDLMAEALSPEAAIQILRETEPNLRYIVAPVQSANAKPPVAEAYEERLVFERKGRYWFWKCVNQNSQIVCTAERSFTYYLDCYVDAKLHGFGGRSYLVLPTGEIVSSTTAERVS